MAEIKEFPTKGVSFCPYCGGDHPGYCPRISSISYYDDGTIEEIYFIPWQEWPEHFERLLKDAMDHNAGVLATLEKIQTKEVDH